MSSPTFVVLPASGGSAQHADQDTAELTSTIQNALHEKAHPEPEQPGPLKQILAHSDSLYKYINWEDPVRTLGAYVGALSVLFGAHYLPLTQVALKGGLTTLGVVSVTEFTSRSISDKSLSARLRPKEYKKVPESTLNATLKDIHDLIQHGAVQVQKIVYGEDLEKTFAAFLGFTALYWLIKIVPPFWLTVLGLTSVFIAPLVSSAKGREVAHDASVRAQELGNAAAEKSKVLAQNGKATANDLSSKGKQTATDLSARARGTASDLSSKGQQTASDLSDRARGTASDVSGTASDLSGSAAENIRQLPQTGTNAINQAPGNVKSALGDAKGYINNTSSNTNGNSYRNQSATGGAANDVSHQSNSSNESANRGAPGGYAGRQPDTDYSQNTPSSFHPQTHGEKTAPLANTGFNSAIARDASAADGILDRPRGAI